MVNLLTRKLIQKKIKREELSKKLLFVLVLFLFVLPTSLVWGHREDYLNKTFVYQTVEPKELELEYWVEYGSAFSSPTRLVKWEQTLSAEFGVTSHWMAEGFTAFRRLRGERFSYLLTVVESRFRLFEEGEKILDPAFSLEYSHSNENGKSEHIIEPTFVLSKDFSRLNFTLDFSLAKVVNSNEKVEAGYALASRYDFRHLLRVGFEAQGEFIPNSPHYFIPQVHLLLPDEITAKLGVGIRHSGQGEKLFIKFMMEMGLEFRKSKVAEGK